MQTIVKMKFGSHLYGTNTPESDTDYKGIFMPEPKDILLGRIPKSINQSTGDSGSKNGKEDIDSEMYSLHYFIKLACEGQTAAFDMLHAPPEMIIESSPIWDEIVRNRHLFYSKNIKAFVGYARKQAAKYGIKGSRLNTAEAFLTLTSNLEDIDINMPMKYIWDNLPVDENARHIEDNPQGIKQYQICGKIIQETVTVEYAVDIVRRFYENYGARAREAANNQNIDWKAISHAVRCCMQVNEMFLDGTMTLPLPDADLVKGIKRGDLDYKTEAAPLLESLMNTVEHLAERSDLPERVDRKYWDSFLFHKVLNHIGGTPYVLAEESSVVRTVLADCRTDGNC